MPSRPQTTYSRVFKLVRGYLAKRGGLLLGGAHLQRELVLQIDAQVAVGHEVEREGRGAGRARRDAVRPHPAVCPAAGRGRKRAQAVGLRQAPLHGAKGVPAAEQSNCPKPTQSLASWGTRPAPSAGSHGLGQKGAGRPRANSCRWCDRKSSAPPILQSPGPERS